MLPNFPRFLKSPIFLALVSSAAFAQTPPDAGRLLQETRPTPATPEAPSLPPIQAPAQSRPAPVIGSSEVRINVTGFAFTGNQTLSSEVLKASLSAWTGRSLNFGDLMQAVEAVEARYKEAGYFLAQANLPPQKIKDGVIEISVSEGMLADARLEGESRITPSILYAHLDQLPKNEALRLPVLERQILLINELAGGQISLDLQAGDTPGSTDIVLVQKPEDLLTGRLEANNHGLPSTGEYRYSLTLNANSPFNRGERITFNAMTSETGGLKSYNLRGELPVGGQGWRATAGASRAEYALGDAFRSLQASGTADTLRAGLAYPLLRSRNANLKFQVEADHNQLSDQYKASNTQLDKTSDGLTASLSGDMQDDWLGGGSNRLDLSLRSGTLHLGQTAATQDTRHTAGSFKKANLNLSRQQTLARNLSVGTQINMQFSGKNLDSLERMSLGGPQSLPGYVSGEAVGDSGIHGKLSLRWQAMPEVALTAFADSAHLRLSHDPIAGAGRNTRHLSDTGIAADWAIAKDFSLNTILAWAGKEKPDADVRPRIWFTVGYQW